MNTTGNAHDASDAPAGQPSAEDQDGRVDAVDTPPRRLLDRISEAVRAAHAASVPF